MGAGVKLVWWQAYDTSLTDKAIDTVRGFTTDPLMGGLGAGLTRRVSCARSANKRRRERART